MLSILSLLPFLLVNISWSWSITDTRTIRKRPFVNRLGTATTSSNIETAVSENSSGDDDDDYEYIEIERLTESDFAGSEWLVGTNWDNNRDKIEETWLRCAVDQDGNNVAIWGDDSKGKWSIDIASGFFSASKESLIMGKKIWATTADDYYYMQGTVRGWSFVSAANVMGQWQARRLGVDKDEAGVPPWFEESSKESDESEKVGQVAAATAIADTVTTKEKDKLEQVQQQEVTAELQENVSTEKAVLANEQASKKKDPKTTSSDESKENESDRASA
ncbi:hypothetical protein FisN_4Lh241 [Fistulifera solaris]|uniref:Uncharacterized protein n=1 Tax=Fistulifera solaris TaxID=1519565 RepID=A0A1Z5KDX1_FISSO|nr:hypothetical protein FisN_4Lh241 [Fistulifera solaris]|eukprot:GAX24158.1 hypothetical protein FisN_4Lh241 [Fistulifera solaris]